MARGHGGEAPGARPMEGGMKPISLALQGGGAHGAFTWGVLDRLLEDGRLTIEGISGTSAGAMNGAMVVYGYDEGGRDGARAALERFWRRISEAWVLTPFQPSWLDRLFGWGGLDYSFGYQTFDALSRFYSPYQFSLLDLNPLRDILAEVCDFSRVHGRSGIRLYACATNVLSGKIKIFGPDEITPDVLVASACLPQLFRAVEINGEPYWDGGYLGNPAFYPIMRGCASQDIVLVQVNPIRAAAVPTTAREIADRVNEISFNATMMREMLSIHFVNKLLEGQRLNDPDRLRRIRFHMIEAEQTMARLGASSKLNGDWDFLCELRDLGRERAAAWLEANYGSIGVKDSLDIDGFFV
jgi:NTE family protein